MASWVAKCWLDVHSWIIDEPNKSLCKTVNLEYNITSKKRSQQEFWSKTKTVFRQLMNHKTNRMKKKIYGSNRSNIYIKLQEVLVKARTVLGNELRHFSRKLKEPILSCVASSKLIKIQHHEPFARFGHSLAAADFDGDGSKELGACLIYLIIFHNIQCSLSSCWSSLLSYHWRSCNNF